MWGANVGIQIKHHMWISWSYIAIAHETQAWLVRSEADELKNPAERITDEFQECLIGLTAASHALDGLYGGHHRRRPSSGRNEGCLAGTTRTQAGRSDSGNAEGRLQD